MNGTLRNKQGCWTCRLRRKKCDEKHPFCATCESLTITCYGYGEKPDFMDNGPREKAMVNSIKQTVKKTSRQKGRLGASMARIQGQLASRTSNGPFFGVVKIAPKPTNNSTYNPVMADAAITPPSTENGSPPAISDTGNGRLPQDSTAGDSAQQEGLSWLSAMKTDEAVLLMHFVDTVFPLQYPMYRPSVLEGGRGWLLSLLLRTKPLYHASLALSAYHRGTILLAASQRGCSASSAVSQEKHLAICLSEFHQAITIAGHWLTKRCPKDTLGLMACVLQLVFFELFAGHNDAWQIHLNASTDIFARVYGEQVVELALVDSPEIIIDGIQTLVFNEGRSLPEETGIFLFLSGVTVWLDVIFSVMTGKSPRLLSLHPHAIALSSAMKLENIMGCKNHAVLQIARISALHEYKAGLLQQGSFNTVEFGEQANNIREELQAALAEYSLAALELSHSPFATPNLEPPDICIITKVYTLAASLYLHLVVCGYRTTETQEVRSQVTEVMMILRTKMPAHLMHAIICPLYIIGGMAEGDDRHFFRQAFSCSPILDSSLEHRSRILPLLEELWRMRDSSVIVWTWQDTVGLADQPILLL